MAQRTVGSSVNVYVKEWEVTFTFGLHGELNALVYIVQVGQEVLQLVGSVWPDDEGVIHVAKPADGLVGCQVKRPLLEVPSISGRGNSSTCSKYSGDLQTDHNSHNLLS
jgi:hypothetical protein